MSDYGIPYQGSKDRIILRFAHMFPKADHFYDLFGGGFSVTHYMIQRRFRDFKHFHFNEIRPGICDLIQKAIRGEFNYDKFKMPWVTREEFFEKKESDAFIKIIWSFGNNGEDYLFGKEIEAQKRSLHMAIIFDEFDDFAKRIIGIDKWPGSMGYKNRRLFVRNRSSYLKNVPRQRGVQRPQQLEQLEQLERLQQLQRLERLQQLQRLEQLEQLEQLEFYSTDYRKVPIKPNSVIYCDIPYAGTGEYDKNKNFDHKEFFDWANAQTNPIYISEYEVRDPRFKLIKEMKTKSSMSGGASTNAVERLYINQAAISKLGMEPSPHVFTNGDTAHL